MTTTIFTESRERKRFIKFLESIFIYEEFKIEFHQDTYLYELPQIEITFEPEPYHNFKFIIDVLTSFDSRYGDTWGRFS